MCEASGIIPMRRPARGQFLAASPNGGRSRAGGALPATASLPPDTGKAGRRTAVVTLMERSNVDTVMVARKVRKWRGQLLDVDIAKLRRELEASRDYLFEAARIKRDLFRA